MSATSEANRLYWLTFNGARSIWGDRLPDAIYTRTEHELATIVAARDAVTAYLVVHDLVKHLRNNGVAIGPGRGRCVSSLAAYALGITGVDPVRHGLLIESFVSANRLSPPVFYLNVGIGGRRKAIDYLQGKYGTDGVAIPASLNEGRIAHVTDILVMDKESKRCISCKWNDTLKCAIAQQCTKEAEARGALVINIEESAAITHVQDCLVALGKATSDLGKIPLDDPTAIMLFANGETKGFPLFDSDGMKNLLSELKPRRFSDIVTAFAIYDIARESTMPPHFNVAAQNIKATFIARRNDKSLAACRHPIMENALAETNGLVVYQEQIMHLAHDLAGFTLHEAGRLPIALGKRILDAMTEMKKWFVVGCLANKKFRIGKWADAGMASSAAESIWQELESAAPWVYPKAHAVCRTLLAYQCAYLKTCLL